MIGEQIFEMTVTGSVSTRASSNFKEWEEAVEESISSLSSQSLLGKNLAISVKFWISSKRLTTGRNDCDNLVKPILDSLKKMGKIVDDDIIFQLSITKYPTNGPERTEIICKEWLR
tara:strand:- start:578 stop:925 length:348 start_codon:yes stop_codon:yes gene_type:complete